ncbi:conjugal transfer protein [Sphingomonas sp. SUN039]|uniref:conjugal transfer protein n=1 Tax=Sphingomonas sp. SUN039 TaxID=2937787 RepID=UPI002164D25E|nr:conjugal transfer protein [Sphingomonas sp. SUN039]UVO53798.1 conjugal transfer protein [Sphingomonas sp. SUN039]
MSDLLSRGEMASLNRALAKRTGGRVRVGPKPMTVAQGIAVWNGSGAFVSDIASNRVSSRSDLTQILGTGTTLAVAASLAGCATFGGNVKGSFACRAPDGICAPTSTIDDAALAMIGGEASAQPAGAYKAPAAQPRPIPTAVEPVRSGEKVLRIVFPAHIDGAGRFRETAAIHAVVERGEWMAGSLRVTPVRMSAALPTSAISDHPAQAAPPMRSLGELAAAAPEVRFPDPVADIDVQNAAESTSASADPDTPVPALAAKPVARRPEKAITGRSGTRVSATLAPAPQGAVTAAAPIRYSLPPKTTVDPMEAIKLQVADRLRTATPFAKQTPPASPSAPSLQAAKPVNGPAAFPVSEVNP